MFAFITICFIGIFKVFYSFKDRENPILILFKDLFFDLKVYDSVIKRENFVYHYYRLINYIKKIPIALFIAILPQDAIYVKISILVLTQIFYLTVLVLYRPLSIIFINYVKILAEFFLLIIFVSLLYSHSEV